MHRKIFLIGLLLFVFALSPRAMADNQKFYLDNLNKALETELEESGVLPPLQVEEVYLISESDERAITPNEAKRIHGWQEFTLANMQLNDSTSRFSAEIVFADKSKNNKVETITVRGKFVKLIELPVLKQIAHNGEIISKGDIEWITYPEKKLRPSMITDAEHLMGKTPNRRILANSIIRTRDIGAPVLIEKGESVTMVYQTEYIKLQTIGRALEDGKKGEFIRIRNNKSKKIIQATVEGKGLVVINNTGGSGLIAKNLY